MENSKNTCLIVLHCCPRITLINIIHLLYDFNSYHKNHSRALLECYWEGNRSGIFSSPCQPLLGIWIKVSVRVKAQALEVSVVVKFKQRDNYSLLLEDLNYSNHLRNQICYYLNFGRLSLEKNLPQDLTFILFVTNKKKRIL